MNFDNAEAELYLYIKASVTVSKRERKKKTPTGIKENDKSSGKDARRRPEAGT